MQYDRFVSTLCRKGYVRTDDEDNVELTVDSNEYESADDIVRMIEDVCDSFHVECFLDRDATNDEGMTFCIDDNSFLLVVVLA